ncbi:MAG: two-component regulator propeller domain-containing protein [Paludibacter sp.]|nr:two-component regulator propeller domain-containing protein [Paludibacter sp.]
MVVKLKELLFIFIFILIQVYNLSFSQSEYSFRPITIDDGLSNFVVSAFYKDSTGFMWIGTDNCLDRFDGINFKHYYFNMSNINKERVKAIVETRRNELYVGNARGLWKINRKTNQLVLYSPEFIDCAVNALAWNARTQNLYIGTDKGLYIIDLKTNKLSHKTIQNNILSRSNIITGINGDDQQKVWLTTKQGLCLYTPQTDTFTLFENKSYSSDLNCFYRITRIRTTLYLATFNAGILKFDITTKVFSKFTDVGSKSISDISSDGKNIIYVATDGDGVFFLSHETGNIIKTFQYNPQQNSGIRSNSVYALLVDRMGIIWVGYYQAGLDYSLYQNHIFKTYNYLPYFTTNGLPVRSFVINKQEKVIGTREGLYYIDESRAIFKAYNKNVLRSNLILCIKFYQGEYYIGTFGGGLSVLDPVNLKIRTLSNEPGLLNEHIFSLTTDYENQLWISTSSGVYCYNKQQNKIQYFNSKNSQLYQGYVYCVFFDSSKKGWIATSNGLCIYDPSTQSINSQQFPENFFNKQIIKGIYEDSKKRLFFCPDKGNIFISDIDMQHAGHLNMTTQFENRVFLSVLEDKNHRYWFGSDYGLINMSGKDDSYLRFVYSDGIPDPVFNANAISQDESGRLWFGNAKGLIYIDPQTISKNKKTVYPVHITDLQVIGGNTQSQYDFDTDNRKNLDLKYNENNLKIMFASLSFTLPSRIVYEYQLEGLDTNWKILSGGVNEVLYTDLNPGSYVFRVRTEGNKASETSFSITIHSFFDTSFYLMFIIFIITILLLTNNLRIRFYSLKTKIADLYLELKQYKAIDQPLVEKYKYVKLGDIECYEISKKLNEFMAKSKPFTKSELKITDIARELNLTSTILSYFFNQYLKVNYYDYINEYRVKEFQKLVAEDENSKFTLLSLAEKCGFTSRASFFRSFKRITNITPNEYVKNIRNG